MVKHSVLETACQALQGVPYTASRECYEVSMSWLPCLLTEDRDSTYY